MTGLQTPPASAHLASVFLLFSSPGWTQRAQAGYIVIPMKPFDTGSLHTPPPIAEGATPGTRRRHRMGRLWDSTSRAARSHALPLGRTRPAAKYFARRESSGARHSHGRRT